MFKVYYVLPIFRQKPQPMGLWTLLQIQHFQFAKIQISVYNKNYHIVPAARHLELSSTSSSFMKFRPIYSLGDCCFNRARSKRAPHPRLSAFFFSLLSRTSASRWRPLFRESTGGGMQANYATSIFVLILALPHWNKANFFR